MLWSAFNTKVREFLPAHNRRQGIQTMIDTLIKAGAADVQRSIPFYQTGHSDIYEPADVTTDGYASIGDLPAGKIQRARLAKYDPDNELLYRGVYLGLEQVSWEYNLLMRGGELSAYAGRIAIEPVTRKFCVVPAINTASRLILDWNGVKTDFANDDVTPFDDEVAQAVADFVLARVTRQVDRDFNLANSYEGSFRLLKRKLDSEARDRVRIGNMKPGSQLNGDETLTTDSVAAVIMSGDFLYQPTITALTGGGGNTLQSRPQNAVTTGTLWAFTIDSAFHVWKLVVGDVATDVDSGYVRPDDYNARVWERIL